MDGWRREPSSCPSRLARMNGSSIMSEEYIKWGSRIDAKMSSLERARVFERAIAKSAQGHIHPPS